jgi:hypothetical protein
LSALATNRSSSWWSTLIHRTVLCSVLTISPLDADEFVPAPVEPPAVPAMKAAADEAEVSTADLLARLQQTEAQLQALNADRDREDLFVAMQDRWSQVRDPSITTVDQQTHSPAKKAEPKKWYDRLSVRGYAQFRLNTTLFEEDDSAPAQHVGDRSVGPNQEFLIRRARVIISGDVSEHMYVYLQPDFAASVPGSPDANQFTQIRDWYGDLYIDTDKVHRVRIGQSKVPFGWENLQSSSNRLPLDRSDSLNSAVRNERDLGLFYYWTPTEAQDLFKEVLDQGLKGSGNYGVLGIGAYNGQGGSFSEQNDNVHLVTRLAVPRKLANGQIFEVGAQAYTGKYSVLSSAIAPLGVGPAVRPVGAVDTGNVPGFTDERLAATFVWYPQPFGFQAEWNVGRGPALNAAQTEIVEDDLSGGYLMVMYREETDCWGTLFPFARYNHFEGGHKAERNAPNTAIDEWEFGLEWQFNPQMELTTMYTITDRTNTIARSTGQSYQQFEGHLLRAQFQINY